MEGEDKMTRFAREQQQNQEEEEKKSDPEKYDENKEDAQKMSSSFYKKEGLDFLYFARPGTAYNNPAAFGQTSKAMGMMGTQTRSQFFSG